MEFDKISGQVIGCAIEVHRNLGPGLLESVYRQCLAFELRAKGLNCETEKTVRVTYKELALGSDLRIDLLVEGSLVVELKSVENLLPLHEAQVLTYMKMAGARTGLLINFNTRFVKEGIRRFVL
jgi:GxxExxY protein